MNRNLLCALLIACTGFGLSACDDDDPERFDFEKAVPSRYSRVDRMGQPATATVLISSSASGPAAPGNPANSNATLRDAFNRADPAGDAADFGGGFVARLRLIAFELGPNLRSFGLTPCSTPDAPATVADTNIDTCLAQAAGVVLPDVITLNPNTPQPDSWPNGRFFDDPVVDRLVAAALLNISQPVPPATAPPHTINTLAGLPLNPAVTAADGTIPRDGTGTYTPPLPITDFPFLRAKNL